MTSREVPTSTVPETAHRRFHVEKKQRRGLPVTLQTIVRRRCAALIPYARNARTHSDQQVAQIAASIRENRAFGKPKERPSYPEQDHVAWHFRRETAPAGNVGDDPPILRRVTARPIFRFCATRALAERRC
jgi:hypothetical protein